MKQTAVEFILEKMQSGKWEYTTWAEREQIIEQAKEMEKQQQGYSEEEVIAFGEFIFKHSLLTHTTGVKSLFEQFKKK